MQLFPIERRPFTWFEKIALHARTPGRCTVCGALTRFGPWLPDLRETGRCKTCNATNRQRQLADLLCGELHAPSLAHIPSTVPTTTKIYNTEASGPMHARLARLPGYVCSEYFGPQCARGDTVNGVRNEDLQRLSFADNSFDYVLSSDVFEHIPDPYRAFAEVQRVLKPGGKHLFTVAFHQAEYEDDVRAIETDGEVKYLKQPWYHGDPIRPEGVLVFTVPGLEMLVRLKRLGFDTFMSLVYKPWRGILGNNAIVFAATKPA